MTQYPVLLVDPESGRVTAMNEPAQSLYGPKIGQRCGDVVGLRGGGAECHPCCPALLYRAKGVRVHEGETVPGARKVICSVLGNHVVVVATPARQETPARPQTQVKLTPREAEVLQLVGEGFSTPQIARILEVRPSTIRTHVENIRSKLEAVTRAEAVVRAVTLGLIAPPSL